MSNRFTRQSKVIALLILIVTAFSFFTFSFKVKPTTIAVAEYYKLHLDSLQMQIDQFEKEVPTANSERIKQLFSLARQQYKKIEFLIEYHYPTTANRLNGAALLEAEASQPNEPKHPSGFQVLEESVYEDLSDETRKTIAYELSTISDRVKRLSAELPELELTESNIVDATRLNIYRLITKGITGFDSPVALNSIEEAAAYFEKYATLLVEKLKAIEDKTWNEQIVAFHLDGNKLFAYPMSNMFWMFMFDIIHHRGQLSTYYRHMGVRNPQIYGPTAEDIEEMMAVKN